MNRAGQPAIALLESLFQAALAPVRAAACLPAHLPPRESITGRLLVLAAGKAAAAMAQCAEKAYGPAIDGLAVVPHGHEARLDLMECISASHPVPGQAGLAAARRMLTLAENLQEGDLLLLLLSGGASSLLSLPVGGISLAEKQAVTRHLLRAGWPIDRLNAVRRRLSAIKGGRLALAAWPASCLTLAISDVPGDDPALVGSGPCLPPPAEPPGLMADPLVAALLDRAPPAENPGDPRFARASARLVARAGDALAALAAAARDAGYAPVILGDDLQGEARLLGRAHAAQALAVKGPAALISGGETHVTVTGSGKGGRAREYLLALGLAGGGRLTALAADSDGIDGAGPAAGAILTPEIWARSIARGLDAAAHLANNDAGGFFDAAGGTLVTGPTLTNVNEIRVILVPSDLDVTP